jgi:hypothetical protein
VAGVGAVQVMLAQVSGLVSTVPLQFGGLHWVPLG